MTWIVIIVAFLALWHYIWDGIIAPSYRAQYRFELFAIRDRARKMKHEGQLGDDRFRYVEESINTSVTVVPSITVAALVESKKAIAGDSELRGLVERRLAQLEQSPAAKELMTGIVRVVSRALCINSGGWFVFLVPVVLVVFSMRTAYRLVERLVSLTEAEAIRAVPSLREVGLSPA